MFNGCCLLVETGAAFTAVVTAFTTVVASVVVSAFSAVVASVIAAVAT